MFIASTFSFSFLGITSNPEVLAKKDSRFSVSDWF
jgi:hypothetical protein